MNNNDKPTKAPSEFENIPETEPQNSELDASSDPVQNAELARLVAAQRAAMGFT